MHEWKAEERPKPRAHLASDPPASCLHLTQVGAAELRALLRVMLTCICCAQSRAGLVSIAKSTVKMSFPSPLIRWLPSPPGRGGRQGGFQLRSGAGGRCSASPSCLLRGGFHQGERTLKRVLGLGGAFETGLCDGIVWVCSSSCYIREGQTLPCGVIQVDSRMLQRGNAGQERLCLPGEGGREGPQKAVAF